MRSIDSKELKKAMINVDLDSFVKLEEETGIHKSTLSDIVKNERKPSYESISVLADALHLSYAEIGRIFFANELAETQI